MSRFTRRDFIKASAWTAGAFAISFSLAGCDGDNVNIDRGLGNNDDPATDPARQVAFEHGVASGDPLTDRVILWTRVSPMDDASPVEVMWEVARDADFNDLTHRDTMMARAEHDFTVKVDTREMLPGTDYYYRFRVGDTVSPVGRTRTLPESVDRVALAAVSCSNYPAGYFHVYNAIEQMAEERDLRAVVHLGDYLYEYAAGEYATQDAEALGRTLPENNDGELLTLTDYRRRYALYRTDPDLQALHGRLPWIVVWDDHEVANDAWEFGAENHNEGEGDFGERKAQALQAYFEWLPIRPVDAEAEDDNDRIIYRNFRFGDVVALQMLDTRIIGRDEQLDYANFIGSGGEFDREAFIAAISDTDRELLGSRQQEWLAEAAAATRDVQWPVLGQQVLMARMTLPAELLTLLRGYFGGSVDADTFASTIAELSALKQRQLAGETLSPTEQARLDTVLPYNLDAWDGYPAARERVLRTFQQLGKQPITLAGDTHNAWCSQLTLQDDTPVGAEFAVSSVSSPGFETYLAGFDSEQLADAFTLLIDDLRYADLSQRGFLIAEFTPSQAQSQWFFVSSVKTEDYELSEGPTFVMASDDPASLQAVSPSSST